MALRIREILVPTDFSRPARAAWEYAQELAIRMNSRVHLVHVLTPPPFALDPLGTDGLLLQVADLLRESGREVKRALAREKARPALEDRVRRRGLAGTPVEEILRYVKKQRIDLVVMGTHGRGPIKHVFLGSVAERVVRNCPVPVVTLHGRARRR
jgi:nucleotide-binding universal stress UspA family protein